jgi:hypothetical protein
VTYLAHVKVMLGGVPLGSSTRSEYEPCPLTLAKPLPISHVVHWRPTPGLNPGSEPSNCSRWAQQPGAVAEVQSTFRVLGYGPPQPSKYIHR